MLLSLLAKLNETYFLNFKHRDVSGELWILLLRDNFVVITVFPKKVGNWRQFPFLIRSWTKCLLRWRHFCSSFFAFLTLLEVTMSKPKTVKFLMEILKMDFLAIVWPCPKVTHSLVLHMIRSMAECSSAPCNHPNVHQWQVGLKITLNFCAKK